jgi:hypothetical protein
LAEIFFGGEDFPAVETVGKALEMDEVFLDYSLFG